ncbi:CLIP domain-containing serine protease B4-like [Choristoneura fumiferana]|uniref:CLIP domain-containing serine protease B4-like n=1 Tax=Choristoneura fumiferana TaxID=7141 RepID=UPI003D156BED
MHEQVFLLCVITLLRSASGIIAIKNCDDCTLASSCNAINDLISSKESAASNQLKEAFCGFDNHNLPKVCCSMLSNAELEGRNPGVDSIEGHPNLQLLPETCGVHVPSKLLGGLTLEPHEYPWMALIAYGIKGGMQFQCSGTLINERYVLTAAHCILEQRLAGVRIGEFDLESAADCRGMEPHLMCEDPIQDLTIEEAIVHPDYRRNPTFNNDIGMLRLKKPVNLTFENAKTICLPVSKDLQNRNASGINATIAGWGISDIGYLHATPRATNIQIYTQNQCIDSYIWTEKDIEFTNKLCAGTNGRLNRIADDGGPLMVEGSNNGSYRFIQYGINSFTISRRDSVVPTVYTDVSKYMKWILDTMKP